MGINFYNLIIFYRYIESNEVRPICEMVGVNPDANAIRSVISYADTNNDGRICFREFCSAIERS